jgi:hypothetical protein
MCGDTSDIPHFKAFVTWDGCTFWSLIPGMEKEKCVFFGSALLLFVHEVWVHHATD